MEEDILKIVQEICEKYKNYWERTSVMLPPELYDNFAEDLKEEFCGIRVLSSTIVPEGQAFIFKDTLDL